MFEHRSAGMLPRAAFVWRMARFAATSALIVGTSLAMGTAGYHVFGGLPWLDSLLNAAMILTGMGPVDHLDTAAGKLFAAAYALYSGLAFVTTTAVLLAPVVHRFLHALHVNTEEERAESSSE